MINLIHLQKSEIHCGLNGQLRSDNTRRCYIYSGITPPSMIFFCFKLFQEATDYGYLQHLGNQVCFGRILIVPSQPKRRPLIWIVEINNKFYN